MGRLDGKLGIAPAGELEEQTRSWRCHQARRRGESPAVAGGTHQGSSRKKTDAGKGAVQRDPAAIQRSRRMNRG